MANEPTPAAYPATTPDPDADGWGARPVPLQRAVGLHPQPTVSAAALPAPPRRPRHGSGQVLAGLRGRSAGQRRAAVLAGLPARSHRVVVMSAAGGVGRSVLTAGVALAVARHRDWPVAAVEVADHGFNALTARFATSTSTGSGATVLDALPLLDRVRAGVQLAPYVRHVHTDRHDRTDRAGGGTAGTGGVHVFAAPGPNHPPVDAATTAAVLGRLGGLYPTVLVDCPPGPAGPYQRAVLAGASVVVLVARAREDDVRRAAAMAQVLTATWRVPLVGVVVAARPGGWPRPAAAAEPVLAARCAALVRLAWDVALAAGAPVSEVGPAGAAALEEIAATTLAAHDITVTAAVRAGGNR